MKQQLWALMFIAAMLPPAAGAGNAASGPYPVTYCVHDIGRLRQLPAANTYVTPAALNNRNQVVGTISNSGVSRPQAFIWERGRGMRILGTLPGHDTANAADINDAGQVVGTSGSYDTGAHRSFIWDKRSGIRELDGSLGGETHGAAGINRFGAVVGGSSLADGSEHAYYREPDGDVFDLGTLPGGNPATSASAVNDLGTVVGGDSGMLFSRVFIWHKRTGIRTLIEEENVSFLPHDINLWHQVVGGRFAEQTRAFRWTRDEGLQDLGTLGGNETDWAEAYGVNLWGTIVGWSQTADGSGRAFVWNKRSGMRNLQDMMDPGSPLAPYAILGTAIAINDLGWIVIEGRDSRDTADGSRTFLLEPRFGSRSPPCR